MKRSVLRFECRRTENSDWKNDGEVLATSIFRMRVCNPERVPGKNLQSDYHNSSINVVVGNRYAETETNKAGTAGTRGALAEGGLLRPGDPGDLSRDRQASLHNSTDRSLSPGAEESGSLRQANRQREHLRRNHCPQRGARPLD